MLVQKRFVWLLALPVLLPALLAAPATASGEAIERTSLDQVIPFDPDVIRGQLKNGVRYYIRANKKPENRAELRLVVNAGSVLEDEDQRGLAHFIEHMAFNGTHHFKKQELVDYLESIGMAFGPEVNAYTSFDETVYMLEVPTDDREILARAFLVLEDWAHRVRLDDEEIEKERGVILEEWRLGRGAGARIRDKQFPIIFKDSRYAERLPIGEPEIIKTAPPEALRRFYRDWYRPDLMAVIAVGDFDPARIQTLIHRHFSRIASPQVKRERIVFGVPDHRETLFAIATDPESTSARVGISYKMDKRADRTLRDARRDGVETLYLTMFNQRLDEIRRRPDPPFLSAYASTGGFVRSRDGFSLSARIEPGGSERALEALVKELARVERHGFNQSEMDRAKTNILRGLEQALKEKDKRYSSSFVWQYTYHFLEGGSSPSLEYSVDKTRELLPTITLQEIHHLARRWITDYNRVFTYSGPEREDAPPPTEGQLLAALDSALSRGLDAWEDKVRDEPLVGQAPAPGRVIEEKRIEELDITEWKLSNGIRVAMKPTDFRNDQILFVGFSPGGHSLVPDKKHTSAIYAGSVLSVGGLGEFDQIELRKALTGKVASARSYIGELEEGVRGSCSPEDLETMFQLLYLKITAPRQDPQAFQSWLQRSRAQLENRLASPRAVFGDKWTEVNTKGHFRRRPSSVEKLEEIDLETAYRIHKERFADCGDFRFVFVGNFKPEDLKPFVETWLGGLPSARSGETWRDVGVRPPRDRVTFEVRKGLEPQSSVRLRFIGDAEWTREEAHLYSALASAVRIRLREILREDMGGTYGVSVSAGISRRPAERASFSVSFGCAPENAEEMVRAVLDEIRSVQENGIEQSYVDKVKESRLRSRETALQENGFWLNVLESAYTFGDDPLQILEFEELVGKITPAELQRVARRYIDLDNYIKGVLLPEEGAE